MCQRFTAQPGVGVGRGIIPKGNRCQAGKTQEQEQNAHFPQPHSQLVTESIIQPEFLTPGLEFPFTKVVFWFFCFVFLCFNFRARLVPVCFGIIQGLAKMPVFNNIIWCLAVFPIFISKESTCLSLLSPVEIYAPLQMECLLGGMFKRRFLMSVIPVSNIWSNMWPKKR